MTQRTISPLTGTNPLDWGKIATDIDDNFTELFDTKGKARLYNFKHENTKFLRKALADTALGVANTNIIWPGDSTYCGYSEFGNPNEIAYSVPTLVAELLSARGLRSNSQNVFGDHGAAIATIDTRVTLGAGWSAWTGGACVGGKVFINASNQNLFQFTPTDRLGNPVKTDTMEIWLLDDSSGTDSAIVTTGTGGLTAPASGGTLTPTGSNTLKKYTAVASTLDNNIWSIKKANANSTNLFIQGINCYDSSKKEVSMINLGIHGQKMSEANDSGFQYFTRKSGLIKIVTDLGAAAAFLNLGINDAANSVTYASFFADADSYITSLKALNVNPIIIVPIPMPVRVGTAFNANTASQWQQDQITAAIYAIADKHDIPLIDFSLQWTSHAVSQPSTVGFYRALNDCHASRRGYMDMAMTCTDPFRLLGSI